MRRLLSFFTVLIVTLTISGTADAAFSKTYVLDDLSMSQEPAESNAFVYLDDETGSKFTVPENWRQESLSQTREALDVKFTSIYDPEAIIFYGSADIWAAMPSSDREGFSRSDINNSILSLEGFAEITGVDPSQVSSVTYGGKEYRTCVTATVASVYGVDVDIVMTYLMRIENGYMYIFQFSGDRTNAYYNDFESLLNSVVYPGSEKGPAVSSYVSTSNDLAPYVSTEYYAAIIFFNLLITIAVCSVPIMIYRYGFVKKPIEKSKAKKITVFYGLAAFIGMSFLSFTISGSASTGGGIILWSLVNYKILTGGKKPLKDNAVSEIPQAVTSPSQIAVAPESGAAISVLPTASFHLQEGLNATETSGASEVLKVSPAQPENDRSTPTLLSRVQSPTDDLSEGPLNQTPVSRKIQYCRKCGSKLMGGSKFCGNCGTQIIEEAEL